MAGLVTGDPSPAKQLFSHRDDVIGARVRWFAGFDTPKWGVKNANSMS